MGKVKTETGYVESFDGTRIYYESHGEGPAIILTYGIGCLLNHWRYQVEYFSQNYRVISYDLRGHHRSEAPANKSDITIDDMGKDLLALAENLGIEEFSAWGHSFGCPVVLSAYERKPEVINSVVMVNGFAYNPFDGKIDPQKMNGVHQRMKMYRKFLPGLIDKVWHKVTSSKFIVPLVVYSGGFNKNLCPREDIERYVKGLQELDTEVYGACFHDMVKWDGRDIAQSVDVPALVIAGVKDKISPVPRQEEFHDLIPNSEILKFAEGTHCTQLDMRDDVNTEIQKFLDSNNKVPRSA